jgi:predicted nucleic acid-binding protein
MILDTTVLVDLQRELRRAQPGPATRLLETSGEAPLLIGFVTWMEFAEGFGDEGRGACESFLSAFRVLWPDADTAWRAARVSRQLQAAGAAIGDHDLWIAALALQHGHPIASRNERHFDRVAGLTIRSY